MSVLPDFIEKRFPSLTGWEYTVDPVYNVAIVTRGQGKYESRNLSAQYPRRRITVRIPGDKEADILAVNRWHHAMRGMAIGFRVMDPSDYLSIDVDPYTGIGVTDYTATTALDQPILETDEVTGGYQLFKRYRVEIDESDYIEQLLPIVKPVAGTIQIANEFGVTQAPARWVLDTATGILQTLGGFVGTPATWGGQYDLPMRFDTSLPIDVREHRAAETTFELLELPR